MECQPIETAPRDGTSVLLYLPGTRSNGKWRALGDPGLTNALDATAEAARLSGRLARQCCPDEGEPGNTFSGPSRATIGSRLTQRKA